MNRIKELRNARKLKQAELAAAVKVSQAALSGYETGKYEADLETYMALADFNSYAATQKKAMETYRDPALWNRMSLNNIAKSGIFAADRSIRDYANNIWLANPVK